MTDTSEATRIKRLKAKASYVGAVVNIFQTTIKISFGILFQSAALVADGIHSLSDLLSDLLVIIAVRLGSREADHEHPYGHRRFETIATVLLGVSLIAIGGGITWSVIERLNNPENLPTPQPLGLAIAATSIIINEWLYHYTKTIAKKNALQVVDGQCLAPTQRRYLISRGFVWHRRSNVRLSSRRCNRSYHGSLNGCKNWLKLGFQ